MGALDHAGPGREGVGMSFQAYLDAVDKKTGKTLAAVVELARVQGFALGSKSGPVVALLKQELGIGHGHAQAMAHVITKDATISDKHVGAAGNHRDESTELRLDGGPPAIGTDRSRRRVELDKNEVGRSFSDPRRDMVWAWLLVTSRYSGMACA